MAPLGYPKMIRLTAQKHRRKRRSWHPARIAASIMKHRSTFRFCRFAVLYLAAFVAIAQSETLPRLEGETLSGKQILLPDDARGKTALMVIGFTKKSSQATRAWGQRFKRDFGNDQRYVVYSVAVLEDVPGFIRGMVTTRIRRGIPSAEQDRFVTVFRGEADLKRFVAYSGPDDAYLLLLDAKGEVQWRGHGLFREQDYAGLQDAAKRLGAQ